MSLFEIDMVMLFDVLGKFVVIVGVIGVFGKVVCVILGRVGVKLMIMVGNGGELVILKVELDVVGIVVVLVNWCFDSEVDCDIIIVVVIVVYGKIDILVVVLGMNDVVLIIDMLFECF